VHTSVRLGGKNRFSCTFVPYSARFGNHTFVRQKITSLPLFFLKVISQLQLDL
jgi:hypothetical protein